MNTTLIRSEDEALSDVLAGILSHLRGHDRGRFGGEFEEDLRREADGFVAGLAGHLQYAEATIFPTLRKAVPGSAGHIEDLEKDHRLLGLYARDLATQIKERNGGKAYRVARSFLAVLLDHIRRETDGVDRCAHAL